MRSDSNTHRHLIPFVHHLTRPANHIPFVLSTPHPIPIPIPFGSLSTPTPSGPDLSHLDPTRTPIPPIQIPLKSPSFSSRSHSGPHPSHPPTRIPIRSLSGEKNAGVPSDFSSESSTCPECNLSPSSATLHACRGQGTSGCGYGVWGLGRGVSGMWDARVAWAVMWAVMWAVECGLWAVGCGMWAVECGLWDVGCGMWAVECGLGNDEFGPEVGSD